MLRSDAIHTLERCAVGHDMLTTRRALCRGLALGAGAGTLPAVWPLIARAQRDTDVVTRMHNDLVRHAGLGDKFSGGPGDNATADWIADRLQRLGYGIEESTFEAPFFVKRAAQLSAGAARVEVVPQAPVVPTASTGITASLALVEDTVSDVRGRMALVVAPFARHAALFADRGLGRTVTAAAQAGAVAIVIVTTGPSGDAVALNAPEQPFVPVPTAVLAPKDAEPFVAAARAGHEATLLVDGEPTHRPSKNVLARLERGERWMAMSTPRSGWYGCVAERGTGTAVFLELAAWVARHFPDLSVFLMNTGGHEYFFAGSHRVLGQAPPAKATLVWAHIGATLAARDAVERDGRWQMLDTADPQRTLMASANMLDKAARGFREIPELAKPVPVRPQAGELSAFTDRGYENAFAVIGVHRWFHTVEDTLACVDAKLLVPVLRAHQATIELAVIA
jgi:hypothetical protein